MRWNPRSVEKKVKARIRMSDESDDRAGNQRQINANVRTKIMPSTQEDVRLEETNPNAQRSPTSGVIVRSGIRVPLRRKFVGSGDNQNVKIKSTENG